MAISTGDLAVALRITADSMATLPAAQESLLSRNLEAARGLLKQYLNDDAKTAAAPAHILDEATIRLAAYLYDSDPVRMRGNPVINSGAAYILDGCRVRKSATV